MSRLAERTFTNLTASIDPGSNTEVPLVDSVGLGIRATHVQVIPASWVDASSGYFLVQVSGMAGGAHDSLAASSASSILGAMGNGREKAVLSLPSHLATASIQIHNELNAATSFVVQAGVTVPTQPMKDANLPQGS